MIVTASLSGFNLWDLADVEKNKIVVPHPKQRVQWTTGLEDDDKYDFLSIDKDDKQSVKVDLKLGKMTAEGSFKYLQETKVKFL